MGGAPDPFAAFRPPAEVATRPPGEAAADDPFWFRSAGSLLGNERPEALPAPADLAATFAAAATADAAAAPDAPRWPDLTLPPPPGAEFAPAGDGAATDLAPDPAGAPPAASVEAEADGALAAYLAATGATLPELETPPPAVPVPSATAPDAASQAAPALPGELDLAWPAGASAALDDGAGRTGAHPLDRGALDVEPPPVDPWAATGTGVAIRGAPEDDDAPAAPPARATEEIPPPIPVASRLAEASEPMAAIPAPPAAVPAPPPPRRAARPPAAAPEAPPRALLSESLWLAALALMAVALLVGWRGHLLSRLRAAVSRQGTPVVELDGVRGGLYDTASGSAALVIRGEVVARSPTDGPIRVRVELLQGGHTVASTAALAGATASPEEVYAASGEQGAAALRQALDARAVQALPVGGRAPFLAVFPPPTPDPQGLDLRATAEPVAAR